MGIPDRVLPPFALDDWFQAAAGRYDLSLSSSDCAALRISDLVDGDGDLDGLLGVELGYGDYAGAADLREIIAAQYEHASPSDVHVFNGSNEAIYAWTRSVIRSGDVIVAQWPLFQPLHEIARAAGADIRRWLPRDEPSYDFDVADLRRICRESPAPRAVVINFPHNPTGRLLTPLELEAVIDIVRESGATLFSDEAFRLLELPPHETLPAACDLDENAVSISGLSKAYGLSGLRIGWLVSRSAEVQQAIQEFRYYTTIATNNPCQHLAVHALTRGDAIVATQRARIARNLGRLEQFVGSRSETLELLRPQGGTMALLRQDTGLDSDELAERALDEQRLLLVPGSKVGTDADALRIGLGRKNFEEGLQRFERLLDGLEQR